MEIQSMPITQIKAAKYNPRKDLKPGDAEFEKLKNSIERWDLVEPLVVNKRTGTLVSGHQRLKVCQALGINTVEAVVVDLSPEREKLLNMSLNKNGSDWDYLKLEELFKEFDPEELNITGFDDDEIRKISALMNDTSDVVFDNSSQEQSPSRSQTSYEESGQEVTSDNNSGAAYETYHAGSSDTDAAIEPVDPIEPVDNDEFIVYVSFGNKEDADAWLEQEGFDVRFNDREMVHIRMSGDEHGN